MRRAPAWAAWAIGGPEHGPGLLWSMGRGALALLGNREGQAIYWSGWLLRGHRSCNALHALRMHALSSRCMHALYALHALQYVCAALPAWSSHGCACSCRRRCCRCGAARSARRGRGGRRKKGGSWTVNGRGMSDFGRAGSSSIYCHCTRAVLSSRVRRAAQTYSLAPRAARAASCGATKAAL